MLVPTLSAVVTGLMSMKLHHRRPGPLAIAGLVLGLAGGLVIMRVWSINLGELARSGVTIFSQRAQGVSHVAPHSFVVYATAAVIALPFAVSGPLLPAGGTAFWLLALYLGVVATAFATTVYILSASRLGSDRASAFTFIVPTAALLLSWLLLGERPDPVTLAGGALSIAAVYLVNARA